MSDIAFYKKVMLLVLPMIVQQTVTNFVSLLDNIMVGQLGTEAISGVAICNQLVFVFILSIFGCNSAGSIFGAQFYGKGDHTGHMYTLRFRVYLCVILAAIAMLLFHFTDAPLISLYLSDTGNPEEIARTLATGREYMSIIIFSFLPFSLANAYSSTIRETGKTLVPMVATLAAVITNIILDYLLIFGPGPFPVLGVKGAAIATVIARIIEMLICIIWTHTHYNECRFAKALYSNVYIPAILLKDMIIKGFPLLLNEILWSMGMATITQCYSVRGLDVVAAYNITSTINNIVSTIYLQLGVCLSIVVGQRLGSGDIKKAVEDDDKMIFFSFVVSAFIGLIFAVAGRFFPNAYNTHISIRHLAASLITTLGLAMPFYSLENSYYFTLRSGGKTMLTFAFDSVYTWFVLIPTASFLAKHTAFPILTVFILVQCMVLPKVLIGYKVVKKGMWINRII